MVALSLSQADFILGATGVLREQGRDSGSSGAALHTGAPKQSASWVSTYLISCDRPAAARTGDNASGPLLVDSVSLSFRYRAAPLNASTNNTAAVLKIVLTNNDNRPIATVVPASASRTKPVGPGPSPHFQN